MNTSNFKSLYRLSCYAFFLSLVLSCANQTKNYTHSNPVYENRGLRSGESVAYYRHADQFYILNPDKIQKWAQINPLEFATEFRPWMESEFDQLWNQISKGAQKAVALDSSILLNERQFLDSNIYIQTYLPKQGSLFENTSPYVWIINQIYLGPNLNKDLIFDQTQKDLESAFIEGAKTESYGPRLSLIVNATLWDNLKQQYLFHQVFDIEASITLPLESNQVQKLMSALITQMQSSEPWRKK